jgi:hypothetical protein
VPRLSVGLLVVLRGSALSILGTLTGAIVYNVVYLGGST